jgi:hypothetical protein
MGLDESVVRVPPGRTGCIVLRREGTFRIRRLQYFGSRHRALSSRVRELGSEGRGGSLDALLYELCSRKGCGALPSKTKVWVSVDPLTRVAWVEIRYASSKNVRPYPGRTGESSPSEVGLTTPLLLDLEARRSSPIRKSMPEVHIVGVWPPQRRTTSGP